MKASPENWPQTEDGEPVAPALLLKAGNSSEVLETRMTLTAMGIPFLLQDHSPATFTTVLFGTQIIGADVYVPETLMEDAKALLEGAGEDNGEPINENNEECACDDELHGGV